MSKLTQANQNFDCWDGRRTTYQIERAPQLLIVVTFETDIFLDAHDTGIRDHNFFPHSVGENPHSLTCLCILPYYQEGWAQALHREFSTFWSTTFKMSLRYSNDQMSQRGVWLGKGGREICKCLLTAIEGVTKHPLTVSCFHLINRLHPTL